MRKINSNQSNNSFYSKIIKAIKNSELWYFVNNPNEQPEINIPLLEKKIHFSINLERKKFNLSNLVFDNDLSNVARFHSQDMARRNYFSHVTPEGIDPTKRAKRYGFRCEKIVGNIVYSGIGENIFRNNLYDKIWYHLGVPTYDWLDMDDITNSTVQGWMNSPGHRENILNSNYFSEGIGISISTNGHVYITENFF